MILKQAITSSILDEYEQQVQDLTTAASNSIAACQLVAFTIYNQNSALELQIVNSPCFVLSTTTSVETSSVTSTSTTAETTTTSLSTTTGTTTICSIDFSQFTTSISNASSTFDSEVTNSLTEESELSDLDFTFQNLFAENGVGPECQDILDQIIPVTEVHEAFLTCVNGIKSNKDNLTTNIQSQLSTATNNCDPTVSFIIFEIISIYNIFCPTGHHQQYFGYICNSNTRLDFSF